MGAASASDQPIRRARAASYGALLALAIGSSAARAQTDCQPTFVAELTRLRGPAAAADTRYRTTFTAEAETLHATIQAEDGSARELSAPGPDCRALASATAVALALLLDAPPREEAPQIELPEPEPELTKVEPPRMKLTAGAGAGLLLGVPRDLAPALLGELGLRRERWRVGLGVLWALPRRSAFGPGDVRSELFAGSARACLQLVSQLALCSGAQLGQLAMRARGYTRNESSRVFWGAVPVELAFDYLWAHVGAELGLAALFPFQRQTFSIDGLGDVAEDWPVQALFSLRLFGVTKL